MSKSVLSLSQGRLIDLSEAVMERIAMNAQKYQADQYRGKYNLCG